MEVYTGDSSNDRFTSVSAHKVPPTYFQWFRCQMEEILRLSEPVWYSRADKTRRRDTGKFLRSPKLSPTVAQPGLVWVLLCVHCPTWQIQKYRTQAGLMGTTWQVHKYNIQASPVYVLLCVQPGKYKNTKYVLLCAERGAYRRSDCPAADSTQSGEEPQWKSLLCSKMDKVELENRVGLESKLQISKVELENRQLLENMIELEK